MTPHHKRSLQLISFQSPKEPSVHTSHPFLDTKDAAVDIHYLEFHCDTKSFWIAASSLDSSYCLGWIYWCFRIHPSSLWLTSASQSLCFEKGTLSANHCWSGSYIVSSLTLYLVQPLWTLETYTQCLRSSPEVYQWTHWGNRHRSWSWFLLLYWIWISCLSLTSQNWSS